jgi:hypothetical protein
MEYQDSNYYSISTKIGDQIMSVIDEDEEDEEEIKFEIYRITNKELNSYKLEDCLNLSSFLREKLEAIPIYSDESKIKYLCNHFEIEDISELDKYEALAKSKHAQSFFIELLHDYAKKNNANGEYLKLVDLQKKLWTLNSGKYLCKLIKENEQGIFKLLKLHLE